MRFFDFLEDPAYLEEERQFRMDCRKKKRPKCNGCGQHLDTDTVFFLKGEWYCSDCVTEHDIADVDALCEEEPEW